MFADFNVLHEDRLAIVNHRAGEFVLKISARIGCSLVQSSQLLSDWVRVDGASAD